MESANHLSQTSFWPNTSSGFLAPGKPVTYNVTSDGMSLTWDAPVYDGGSEVTGYHVEKKRKKQHPLAKEVICHQYLEENIELLD